MVNQQDLELYENNPAYWQNSPHNLRMLLSQYQKELITDLNSISHINLSEPRNKVILDVKRDWESLLARVEALLEKDPYKKDR